MSTSPSEMTFFEHVDALRPHLLRSATALLVVMVVAFLGRHFVIDTLLFGPQSPDFPTNRALCYLAQRLDIPELCTNRLTLNMVNTSMAGQLNLHLVVSFWAAMVVCIPYLIWEMWQFVKPALTPRERRATNRAVLLVSLSFITGLLFGYFIIAPLTVNFLGGYQASGLITNMIDANSYLSTVMNVSLVCGLVFLLPLLVWLLARMGILSATFMRRYRRHAIVVLAITAAIITPPDVFSMILVLMPIYGLYELSIGIAARVERKTATA